MEESLQEQEPVSTYNDILDLVLTIFEKNQFLKDEINKLPETQRWYAIIDALITQIIRKSSTRINIAPYYRTRLIIDLKMYWELGDDYLKISKSILGELRIIPTGLSYVLIDKEKGIIYKLIKDAQEKTSRTYNIKLEMWCTALVFNECDGVPRIYEPIYDSNGNIMGFSAELIHGKTYFDKIWSNFENFISGSANNLKTLLSIIDTLSVVHELGLIHRDIKPNNIVVTDDGRGKLIDFNLVADPIVESIPGDPPRVCGTDKYISPEIAQGVDFDHRSDLYSLGIIIYETIFQHPPFRNDSARTNLLMHVNSPIPLPQNINKKTEDFLLKVTAKNPNDRFQTAKEMKEGLQEFIEFYEVHGAYTHNSPSRSLAGNS
ncbi:protein kinase [Patescibacteria group bacterium]|nr:protein kinase [Patescibacteria group bacterium]